MSVATITSLISSVRARLNMTNVATISDADITTFIKSSHANLYEKIVSRWKNYYLTGRYVMDLQALQETYPLPADFRANAQVFLRFGTGINLRRRPMEPFNLSELSHQPASYSVQPQYPLRYFLSGMNITFSPMPSQQFVQAIEIWYTPQYQAPANVNAPFDIVLPNGWELWVELDVCTKVAARIREPTFFQMYASERAAIEKDVIAAASIRDEQPQYMTDAYNTNVYEYNFYSSMLPGV